MTTPFILAAGGETPTGIGIFLPAFYDVLWSLVPFALIMIFFWKFVIPRFRQVLDDRSESIEGGIVKAEKAQAEASAALEEYNRQLSEARAEAAQIREQARSDGAEILAELKEQAQAEAARLTAQAHEQIEADRQAAVASLRSEVGLLALDLAGGVIGESLSNDRKATAVVDRFLADLAASEKVSK